MLKYLFYRFLNLGRPGHTVWHASWKFRCDFCGKFMAFKTSRGGLHKHCVKQYMDAFDEAERYTQEQYDLAEAKYWADLEHMDAILDTFCAEYACWKEIDFRLELYCPEHDLPDEDDSVPDMDEEANDSYDPAMDEDNESEECLGGCGQPAYACTCAELESLRRHNANPETRGSYWVA